MEDKSEINGTGYGSKHLWKRGASNQVGSAYWLKASHYTCKRCGAYFSHQYDLIPNIFENIKQAGVAEDCVG